MMQRFRKGSSREQIQRCLYRLITQTNVLFLYIQSQFANLQILIRQIYCNPFLLTYIILEFQNLSRRGKIGKTAMDESRLFSNESANQILLNNISAIPINAIKLKRPIQAERIPVSGSG